MAAVTGGWWSSLQFGNGALWLTDRRLIFQHQRLRLTLGPARIEIPLQEIASVRRRSILRSLLGVPFMGSMEVRLNDGKRYNFQALKTDVWIAELAPMIHHTKS
jgi:hypothetical protein